MSDRKGGIGIWLLLLFLFFFGLWCHINREKGSPEPATAKETP